MSSGNRPKNNRGTVIKETNLTIKTSDGFPLAATLFSTDSDPYRKAIVMGSALGVPRYIYFKLAKFLSRKGFSVLTFDYRGVHESQHDMISGSGIRMTDWGRLDIDAALNWAIENLQPKELIYLAHSCGGQLLGLAENATKIHKALFIACQSGYWKLWPIPQRWGLWMIWSLIPAITRWFDDFPARTVGLSSVNIPSGVAKQWAQWGKLPNYLWDSIPKQDYKRYQQLSFPLLSIGFSDDRYFGPPEAVRKLLSYYPSAKTDFRVVAPSDYKRNAIGHFGFLKEDFKPTLWRELAEWLLTDLEFNTKPLN